MTEKVSAYEAHWAVDRDNGVADYHYHYVDMVDVDTGSVVGEGVG